MAAAIRGRSFVLPPVLAAALTAVLFLSIAWAIDHGIERRLVQAQKIEVALRLQPYADHIAQRLERRLNRLRAVVAFVDSAKRAEQLDRDLPDFTANLLRGSTGAQFIALQRGRVVTAVYPAGGRTWVQHAGLSAPAGPRAAGRADTSRVAAGDLRVLDPRIVERQWVAVVAVQSIHSDILGAPDAASTVIPLDSLLARTGLDAPLADVDAVILDRQGDVVSPWRGRQPADPVRADIALPDGALTIEGAPKGGWDASASAALAPLRIAGLIVALLLAASAYFVAGRQRILQDAVFARTRELAEANVVLRREVTEREKAEQALRAHEEQAFHRQKMEAIGTLTGGIAHDFNNLLTAIVGFAQLADDGAKVLSAGHDAAGVHVLRTNIGEVLLAAHQASILTNQLLAFSRQSVVHQVTLDVGEVIADVEGLVRRLVRESIRFAVQVEDHPATTFIDRAQLVQVVMNLAMNARDAMPDGGDLTIEVRRRVIVEATPEYSGVPPGSWIELAMTDTGAGMSTEVLSHAFEPYFTTKGLGKGTGLGLSTVYGIVTSAGGYVLVTSDVGRGARFRVLFPETAPSEPGIAPRVSKAPATRAVVTVLVAEDQPAVRSVVVRVLRGRGCLVLEAASGEEALAMSAATPERIHLLLTDLVMTGISGLVLAEKLRVSRPGIKVLFMSGYSAEASSLGPLDEVHSAFIGKPFTPDRLFEVIRTLLADTDVALV